MPWEYVIGIYPPYQEKQAINAQTDPQKCNLVGIYYIDITGKESLLWETNLVDSTNSH